MAVVAGLAVPERARAVTPARGCDGSWSNTESGGARTPGGPHRPHGGSGRAQKNRLLKPGLSDRLLEDPSAAVDESDARSRRRTGAAGSCGRTGRAGGGARRVDSTRRVTGRRQPPPVGVIPTRPLLGFEPLALELQCPAVLGDGADNLIRSAIRKGCLDLEDDRDLRAHLPRKVCDHLVRDPASIAA